MIPKGLEEWANCKRCGLCKSRRKIVFGRGVIPADILFVAEAPGFSEDVRGIAFCGKASRILNPAMTLAAAKSRSSPSFYITNLLACIPTIQTDRGTEIREPDPDEILACRPRLVKTIALVKPRRVVLMGKPAQREAGSLCPDALHLYHPAYIARSGGKDGPEFKAFVRELTKLYREVASSQMRIPRRDD